MMTRLFIRLLITIAVAVVIPITAAARAQKIEHEAIGLDAVLAVARQRGFQFPQGVLAGTHHQQIHRGLPIPRLVEA